MKYLIFLISLSFIGCNSKNYYTPEDILEQQDTNEINTDTISSVNDYINTLNKQYPLHHMTNAYDAAPHSTTLKK